MTMMGPASNIIGTGGQLSRGKCIKDHAWFVCVKTMECFVTLVECLIGCSGYD
jgi:hypothetical protein